MAKYRDGRANIRGRENRTIQFPKPDHPVSLDQANTSAAGSLSNQLSRTPPQQNTEGQDRHRQEHHPMPYFPISPLVPGPWGAPPMMYPPCPPWVRWYGPWALPPMHFHLGCLGLAGGFGHGGYQAEDDRYGGVVQQQTKQENRQSGIPNRTIRFPRRQQKLQGSHTSNRCEDQRMLGVRGTIKIRKGRRVKLRPMTTKQSPTRRRVHMWLQRSRTKPKTRRQRS
jgi:hypothetical protein